MHYLRREGIGAHFINAHIIYRLYQAFDKYMSFGEAATVTKPIRDAGTNGAVNWEETKMGFLVPACMLAMILICAVTLTRL